MVKWVVKYQLKEKQKQKRNFAENIFILVLIYYLINLISQNAELMMTEILIVTV